MTFYLMDDDEEIAVYEDVVSFELDEEFYYLEIEGSRFRIKLTHKEETHLEVEA